MKRSYRIALKVFAYIFATAALAGFTVGGIGGMFAVARALAPFIIVVAAVVYGLVVLVRKAEQAEKEENQTLNLAKAVRDAKMASESQSGPIIP